MTSTTFRSNQQTDRRFSFQRCLTRPLRVQSGGDAGKVAALGLPLSDSGPVGLLVARAEVYLDGNMLVYIKSHPSCSN